MSTASPDQDSHTPQQLYQRGLSAIEAGRYAEAVGLLSGLENEPGLSGTMARYYLGQAHLNLGIERLHASRHAEALSHFQQARILNPNADGLAKYIAACYAGQGRFDLAAGECGRSRVEQASDRDLPIRLAHALARDGQMQRAVATLVDAIDRQPYRVDVRKQLGLLYAASEQFEDAICVFQEAAEMAPVDPELRQHLGMAHAAVNEHDDAVRHLAIAQKLRPDDAYLATLLTLAINAAKTSCVKLAISSAVGRAEAIDQDSLETLGEIITTDPEFVEAFLSLPASEMDAKIFVMLAAILERALELHPDYADLYYHCARVHERLGLTDAAIAQARTAVEINPRYAQALIQLGRLYARTDQSDEAIGRLRRAIDCGARYPDVHFLLGRLYHNDGKTQAACREYRRALQLNARYEPAHEALAEALQA